MIGRKVLELMAKKGMKQIDLAKKAGIDQSRLSQIIRGVNKQPRMATLEKLADALGVSVDELLGKKQPEPEIDLSDLHPKAKEIYELIMSYPPQTRIRIYKEIAQRLDFIDHNLIKELIRQAGKSI